MIGFYLGEETSERLKLAETFEDGAGRKVYLYEVMARYGGRGVAIKVATRALTYASSRRIFDAYPASPSHSRARGPPLSRPRPQELPAVI